MKSAKSFLLAAAALLFLMPPPAAGQRAAASAGFAAPEAPISPPYTPGGFMPLLLDSRQDGLPPVFGTRNLPLIMEEKRLRKRLLPYFLAGAVAGGIAGYLYRDRIDRTPTDEDWGVGYIIWPLNGIAVGGALGLGVGYILERR